MIMSRLRALVDEHPAFIQLLALFVAFRALAALFLQPGGFLVPWSPDQLFYHAVGSLSGTGVYPYLDYWVEFPPIFPWLVVGAYKLTLLIPGTNNIFWFNAILRTLMLPFEAGSLWLVYRIVDGLRGREPALRAATAFSLLFAPLFAFLGWFDSVVLFFMLLAMLGLVEKRMAVAGLGIGLGFGTKLFPMAVLPAAVQVAIRERHLWRLLTATGVSLAAVFLPFLIASPAYTLAFFRTLGSRVAWETVWALIEGYTGYGAVAPLSIRDDPATVGWLPEGVAPSRLPWPWITVAFAIVGLFLWTRRIDWQAPRRSTAFAGLTFGIMMLYARGYSPQWGIYLAALPVVLLPGMRGVVYGIGFSALTALEWPLAFQAFAGIPGVLSAIVVVRTILTLFLCVEFSAVAYEGTDWLGHIARPLPAMTCGGLIAFVAVGIIPAYTAYRAEHLAQEPVASLTESWRADTDTQQVILVTQSSVRERLRALVPARIPIESFPNAFSDAWAEPDEWVSEALTRRPLQVVWFVRDQSQPEYVMLNDQLDRALSEQACKLLDQSSDQTRASAYLAIHPAPNQPVGARFGDSIELVSSGLAESNLPAQPAWCVTLLWRVLTSTDQRYEVVLQIRDAADSPVYEHRMEPVGGTNPIPGWQSGDMIEDAHGLAAPLAPGTYHLFVRLSPVGGGESLPIAGTSASRLELAVLTVHK